jgi:hypothetical protein
MLWSYLLDIIIIYIHKASFSTREYKYLLYLVYARFGSKWYVIMEFLTSLRCVAKYTLRTMWRSIFFLSIIITKASVWQLCRVAA